MNATDTISDEKLDELLGDGLECEDAHAGDYECSIEVTHLGEVGCLPEHSGHICQNSANYAIEMMESGMYTCKGCNRDLADCWSVRPI